MPKEDNMLTALLLYVVPLTEQSWSGPTVLAALWIDLKI